MRAFQQMAAPFEKEHIFMPRAFFRIQENSALASIPLPAHPSAQSVEFCAKLPWFSTWEQEAWQKGTAHCRNGVCPRNNQGINWGV